VNNYLEIQVFIDNPYFGNPHQLWVQFIGVAATIVFAFVVTTMILHFLKATMGLRVSEEEERMGLDLTQHDERGYA
jgi:Amt family ammonium transporter